MVVDIRRTNGTREVVDLPANDMDAVAKAIGADVLDVVNLRDGRVMFVDDLGHDKNLPVNRDGTALYWKVCRPGTTWEIVGDVAICQDAE